MNGVSALLWLLLSETVAPVQQLRFIHETLESVHKEHCISTLLVMQRRHQKLPAPDPLQPFYPLAWPTLRLDEGQRVELVTRYNKVVLALLYIDAYEDLLLLDALAEIFNQMREARIVVWLRAPLSKQLLAALCQKAAEHMFLQLLVLEGSSSAHRLQTFLHPYFQSIQKTFREGKLFPISWFNFQGKEAKSLLDEVPPRSFVWEDRIGSKRYSGLLFALIQSFATKRNISIKLGEVQSGGGHLFCQSDIIGMTLRGDLDLPMTAQMMSLKHLPCGKELCMGDMFNSIVVVQAAYVLLWEYILFTVVESLMGAIYNRLAHRRCDFRCLSLLINQRVFRSLLELPVPFVRNRLRDSNLTVFFNAMSLRMIRDKVDPDFLSRHLPNVRVIQGKTQMELISSLNTSYAYQRRPDRFRPAEEPPLWNGIGTLRGLDMVCRDDGPLVQASDSRSDVNEQCPESPSSTEGRTKPNATWKFLHGVDCARCGLCCSSLRSHRRVDCGSNRGLDYNRDS
ncbi:uncharacterized protein LOC117191456 [Drosophila miranda]|uniref:uncharacterized protein LOC117191456 n=1 Tax=Drosophila miranda TaxID=7229 RepID=UPI00143F723D|nr:uncharacterized protein LOC117191456 [Drosophila miranda]